MLAPTGRVAHAGDTLSHAARGSRGALDLPELPSPDAAENMIQKLVALALRMRASSFRWRGRRSSRGSPRTRGLDIEAYPNPVPPMVEVIAQPTGWSAEEVERYVTIPLEIGLAGMPGLDHIRSQSLFGLSDVKCYFKWGIDYEDARQEVINRLQFVQLPERAAGASSRRGTRSARCTATRSRQGLHRSRDLKTAEDWILERQFKQVPGVIDVTSFGGETKEYHVEVDPYPAAAARGSRSRRSRRRSPTPTRTSAASASPSASSRTTSAASASLKDVHDIENIVVAEQKGVPVRVRDVADVNIGYAPRLGIVGHDDEPDVVQGVVLMRYGGETPSTLEGVHERVELHPQVPPPAAGHGASCPTTTAASSSQLTTHTVLENLVVGMRRSSLIVLLLFLGNIARRAHHRAQHPARAAHRVHRHGRDGHAGEPHLARRRRLRHRRRLDRHHDGEHLPPPRRARERHDAASASSRARARSAAR